MLLFMAACVRSGSWSLKLGLNAAPETGGADSFGEQEGSGVVSNDVGIAPQPD